MPFGPYTDHADCVAKNQDKEDPDAYCATIKRQAEGERLRHSDFKKINRQFLHHIKDECDAIKRYYHWIAALNLDETCSYANSMREQFKWVRRHVDFKAWKEDRHAKYWMVDAAYPVESMNENIYSLQELQEATRTAKGTSANLNHKFPLPTVSIEAAKYEDGVAECVVRVPKNLMCPICDTSKTINELIEDGEIVNVSLEAVCTLESDDPRKCEGMEFTGLALLTNATLPGIPLTRLMPLEHIMVEAFKAETQTKQKINLKEKNNMKKVTKIRLVAKEQDEEPSTNLQTQLTSLQKEIDTLNDKVYGADADPESKVKLDILYAKKQKLLDTIGAAKEQVTTPDCPEGKMWSATLGQCVDDDYNEPTAESSGPEMPALEPSTDIGNLDKLANAVLPDEHGNCPEGYIKSKDGQLCIETETCPENQHFDQTLLKCVSDNVPEPTGPVTSVGIGPTEKKEPDSATHDTGPDVDVHLRELPRPELEEPTQKDIKLEPRHLEQPDNAPSIEPVTDDQAGKELGDAGDPHKCLDGHHYDYEADMCVPDTLLTERIRRYKAEDKVQKAKDKIYGQRVQMERLNARWEKRYSGLSTQYEQMLGGMKQRAKRIRNLESSLGKTRQEREDLRVELRQFKGDFADRTRDNKQLEGLNSDLRIENATLKKKYHAGLATNLDLSRKNTQANEDYLAIARERDELKEKLIKARIMAKKTLKIKI